MKTTMNEEERALVALVVGYHIRHARQLMDMSQAELSQGIGSQSMISLLESGRQFPIPDVLRLIGQRVSDATLVSYADLIASGQSSVSDFTSTNHEILVEMLRAHRGRWHDVHVKVALDLCEYFYTSNVFSIVRELCQFILVHSTDAAGHVKAFFYTGSACLFAHEYEQSLGWLRQAIGRSDLLDDFWRGRLYYNLSYAFSEFDSYSVAIWYAKLAVDTFLHINDYPRHGKSLGLLGAIQCRMGRTEDARDTLRRAHEVLNRWGMTDAEQARIATSMAAACESLGEIETAEQWCHTAIESGIQAADHESVCAAYQTLGLVHMARGEPQAAMDVMCRAIKSAERTDDSRSLCNAYLSAAGLAATLDERIAAAEHAYQIATQAKHHIERGIAADYLANLLAYNDSANAAHYSRMALQSYRQHIMETTMFSSAFRYLPLTSQYES